MKRKSVTCINGEAESHGNTRQESGAGSLAKPHASSVVKGAGINKSHCASFCLVNEVGQPIFCASEERFTRLKLQRGMPYQTYKYAAQHFNLSDVFICLIRHPALKFQTYK